MNLRSCMKIEASGTTKSVNTLVSIVYQTLHHGITSIISLISLMCLWPRSDILSPLNTHANWNQNLIDEKFLITVFYFKSLFFISLWCSVISEGQEWGLLQISPGNQNSLFYLLQQFLIIFVQNMYLTWSHIECWKVFHTF